MNYAFFLETLERRLMYTTAPTDPYIVTTPNTQGLEAAAKTIVDKASADGFDFSGGFDAGEHVTVDLAGLYDTPHAVLVQPDGRILVAGQSAYGRQLYRGVIIRLNADGSRDAAFGNDGVVFVEKLGYVSTLVVQPDGKIVAGGGYHTRDAGEDFGVARLNADGSRDGGFGDGGVTHVDFKGIRDSIRSLALSADGKIIVAGTANDGWNADNTIGDFGVARLNVDGSLDTTFNGSGKFVFDGGEDSSAIIQQYLNKVLVLADGKILVGGSSARWVDDTHSDGGFALLRLNANGTLDTSFGIGGHVVHIFPFEHPPRLESWQRVLFNHSYLTDLAVQADGSILALGQREQHTMIVARYSADGTRQTTQPDDKGYSFTPMPFGSDLRFLETGLPGGRFSVAVTRTAIADIYHFGSVEQLDRKEAIGGDESMGFPHIKHLALTPDGDVLAVGDTDQYAYIPEEGPWMCPVDLYISRHGRGPLSWPDNESPRNEDSAAEIPSTETPSDEDESTEPPSEILVAESPSAAPAPPPTSPQIRPAFSQRLIDLFTTTDDDAAAGEIATQPAEG